MVLRLFVIFLIGLVGYLGYKVYGLYDARSHLTDIQPGYHFGPEDADLTVVEFMDYTCPYCQEVHPSIMEAVRSDGNVKYAPFPVLSRNVDGSSAGYILYAAAKMGKFEEAHEYLITNPSNLVRDRLPEITAAIGVDEEEFTKHLDSKEVHERVLKNTNVSIELGNLGTPTFFFGPNIKYIPTNGLPDVEEFQKLFAEARASQ